MNFGSRPWLIAVMGPTASGKTTLAEQLADSMGAQLINADAFQVYWGLDIGTDKPERKDSYELLDIKHPSEPFGVGEFVVLASKILRRLFDERRHAVIVGGTGFYVRALLEGFDDLQPAPDPELRRGIENLERESGLAALVEQLRDLAPDAAAATDLQNPVRVRRALERALSSSPPIRFEVPAFRKLKVGLRVDKAELDRRIDARAEAMLLGGWVQEVERLMAEGVQVEMPGMRAIGYSDVAQLVAGAIDAVRTLNQIRAKTRQYAKRQITWLKSEPGLKWLDSEGETDGVPKIGAAFGLLESEDKQENG